MCAYQTCIINSECFEEIKLHTQLYSMPVEINIKHETIGGVVLCFKAIKKIKIFKVKNNFTHLAKYT